MSILESVNVRENEVPQSPIPDDSLIGTKYLDPQCNSAVQQSTPVPTAQCSSLSSKELSLKVYESGYRNPTEDDLGDDVSRIYVEALQDYVPQVSYSPSHVKCVPGRESSVEVVPGGFQSKYKQENTDKGACKAPLEHITPAECLGKLSD